MVLVNLTGRMSILYVFLFLILTYTNELVDLLQIWERMSNYSTSLSAVAIRHDRSF